MASLTSRITVCSKDGSIVAGDPEDYLADALGTIFSDDATCQHGDSSNSLLYSSPYLPIPRPLHISLSGRAGDQLFGHHLWNASLLLAELVERGEALDVQGKTVLEMGAGTGLPSVVAGLKGADEVVVTDYPAKEVLETLETNIERNIVMENSLTGTIPPSVQVLGHEWGVLPASSPLSSYHHASDIIFLADCLWMPWQHHNLHLSISYFLRDNSAARCWVVAGFHTGRRAMSGFFDEIALHACGLEVEKIWERDLNGGEREWDVRREEEDAGVRKRWLVVAVLKRRTSETPENDHI